MIIYIIFVEKLLEIMFEFTKFIIVEKTRQFKLYPEKWRWSNQMTSNIDKL